LLDALEALHGQGIYHRDIKPANIMLELPSHRPKLIDFNIAAKARRGEGRAGTTRYWAPDVTTAGWGAARRPVLARHRLYELLVHRHPFPHDRPENGAPYDPRQLAVGFVCPTSLREFLLLAVQPHAAATVSSRPADMKTALALGSFDAGPGGGASTLRRTFGGIQLEPGEVGRTDYNPYVTRMLTLYSQARRTNTGTRGLDDIARLTYVRSGLDKKLAPAITTGDIGS
jgi:serine/threonine protein kinase